MSEADGGYGRFGDDVADRDPARDDAAGEEPQVVDLQDDAARAPAADTDDLDEAPGGALDDGALDDGALDDGADHDVPEAPRTGDAGVDEAVGALRAAVGGPLDGQVAAYDAVHRALQDRLADVEG